MPKYVIDTCSLIQMRRVYPKDIFPGAWEKLTDLSSKGILISAEDVLEELKVFDDEILEWAFGQSDMFVPLDHPIQQIATTILNSHPTLIDLKMNKSSGDPFLIATAIHKKCVLVTEEKPTNSTKKTKIPNVCEVFGVECISLVSMFRNEGLKL